MPDIDLPAYRMLDAGAPALRGVDAVISWLAGAGRRTASRDDLRGVRTGLAALKDAETSSPVIGYSPVDDSDIFADQASRHT
jgi:hypothetical protein